jgi:hypothetical protein
MSTNRSRMNRRAMLAGLTGSLVSAGTAGLVPLLATAPARGTELSFSRVDLRGGHDADLAGLLPDVADDQSRRFQNAPSTRRRAAGRILRLPPGSYVVSNIDLPDGARIIGVPGATRLIYGGRGHFMLAEGRAPDRTLRLDARRRQPAAGRVCVGPDPSARRGRGGARGHGTFRFDGLRADAGSLGRARPPLRRSLARRLSGLYAMESRGLSITDNVVRDCANGGILVHRWSVGEDATHCCDATG